MEILIAVVGLVVPVLVAVVGWALNRAIHQLRGFIAEENAGLVKTVESNTKETKNVVSRLDTLNGKVARHEISLGQVKIEQAWLRGRLGESLTPIEDSD